MYKINRKYQIRVTEQPISMEIIFSRILSQNEGPPNGILVASNKVVNHECRIVIGLSRICLDLPKFRLRVLRLETLRIREKIISIEMGRSITLYNLFFMAFLISIFFVILKFSWKFSWKFFVIVKIKYLRITVKRKSKERHAYLQNKPSRPWVTEINPFKTENEKYVEVSESILHSCFTKIDKGIP